MAFVEWSPEFSVGVEEIDDDHKKLLELLNHLEDAVTTGRGRDILSMVLDELVLYVGYHFAHEEELFERTSYPGYERHRLQHRALTTTVREIYEDFKLDTSETMPQQILVFLKNWLYDHILGSDRAFGLYLSTNRIDIKPPVLQHANSV
jgi:hemerythrin